MKNKKYKKKDDILLKKIEEFEGKKMEISLEQREAYSEVLEVLRHMDKFYVNKIPKKIIMFFYDNCSLDYEFRMTKSIGEENLKEKTLDLLALLNLNYWSKVSNKEDLIMQYSIYDKKTQKQLNSQLEKENIFTKIDVSDNNINNENLPTLNTSVWDTCKKILQFIKDLFIKFFGD